MKKSSLFQKIYLGLITVLMYLPIVLVVIYSFNESKISSIWGGFSLNGTKVCLKTRTCLKP